MAGPFDFTGNNIQDTYQRVVQTDGTNFFDGTGSAVTFGSPFTAGGISGSSNELSASLQGRITTLENNPSNTDLSALNAHTGSINAATSSFALTANVVANSATSSFLTSSPFTAAGISGAFNGQTSSFALTANVVANSSTSSFALSTDVVANSSTSSFALSADVVANSSTSSFALTDDVVANSATSSFLLNTSDTLTGTLTVIGDIIAENYIVSSSVTFMTQSFSSGSTIFGDDQTDTHLFTGSVDITGNITAANIKNINIPITADTAFDLDNFNTASINGSTYDYTLISAESGSRTGQFFIIHYSGSYEFTDNSTNHIGPETSIPSLSASLSSNLIKIQSNNGKGYTFKAVSKRL
tara:strand:- start:10027 stop:11094 length:1068 start_codon:yes stop_codon:yes gene_type:complete